MLLCSIGQALQAACEEKESLKEGMEKEHAQRAQRDAAVDGAVRAQAESAMRRLGALEARAREMEGLLNSQQQELDGVRREKGEVEQQVAASQQQIKQQQQHMAELREQHQRELRKLEQVRKTSGVCRARAVGMHNCTPGVGEKGRGGGR